ncbi:hypothetical protein [Carboxylicivirga sp. N1Y90]|uniref:hypothetical protein n=1 Tax=Carboxylicivirga fragile TaxID=3417571 RepID=UPI003D33C2DD|nr:DUF4133 domain-containing protein [Marinilabiliaceae bacterium N1Y90]
MKGKKHYRISKVDTKLYVKGFSGVLVYKALYAVLISFGGFTVIYLLTSPLLAVFLTVPLLLFVLYRLSKIQRTMGPEAYQKQKIAKQLPQFISMKHPLKKIIKQ